MSNKYIRENPVITALSVAAIIGLFSSIKAQFDLIGTFENERSLDNYRIEKMTGIVEGHANELHELRNIASRLAPIVEDHDDKIDQLIMISAKLEERTR